MAKTKRFSPPALIVGTIFLVAAVAILAAALGALQGVQSLFTQAAGRRPTGSYYVPSQAQRQRGCVPRPSCLDENPACQVMLPPGMEFCELDPAVREVNPTSKPTVTNPRTVPAPSVRPMYQ